jgi:uncharacterized protein related to proFAR isomerase
VVDRLLDVGFCKLGTHLQIVSKRQASVLGKEMGSSQFKVLL